MAGKELLMGKRSQKKIVTGGAIYVSERHALEIIAARERRNLTEMLAVLIREGAERRGVPVEDAPPEPEHA